MRRWIVEYADDENWERVHKVITVKACTLKGAFKRAFRKVPKDCNIYQISTRREGVPLPQPVWDFFNGATLCPSKLMGGKRYYNN